MKKIYSILLVFLSFISVLSAQNKNVEVPDFLNFKIDEALKKELIQSLNTLLNEFDYEKGSSLIGEDNHHISKKLFKTLWSIEYRNPNVKKKIINAYRISDNQYLLKLIYSSPLKNEDEEIDIHAISSIIATETGGKFRFSSPLSYHTRNWKNKKIGNVEYHYKGGIDEEIAKAFDVNNTRISNKLGISLEALIFYKCSNYQETLKLIGLDYLLSSNGEIQLSDIIGNTILTGLNSEDFSHDIFHYYSSKKHRHEERNWVAEEGIAYSWGNAYYTKENHEMISRNELVFVLKDHLKRNSEESLLDMFLTNKNIFNDYYSVTSVKSVISSLLCDKVEKEKGIVGIKKLISCGKGTDNFLKSIKELIGIDKSNFNTEVQKLINKI